MKYRILCLFLVVAISCSDHSSGIVPKTDEPVIYPPHLVSRKKGACITTKNDTWSSKVSALNVYWHYSWGVDASMQEPDSVRFVPMIWGKWSLDRNIHQVDSLAKIGKVTQLLGFNEPDGKDQANLTVEESLSYWPKLMNLNIPLGSPACVHADNAWMKGFMAKVEEKGYRVDFICVHWYGGANAQSLIDHLKSVHDLYDRPIWLTEFAPADWNASSPETSKVTKAKALAFMQQILPALESLDFVERYAWFSASPESAALGNAALFDNEGKLTPLGEYYCKFN